MTNPRRIALIGLASAVAAIASTPGPELSLIRPEVYHITFSADTIWFCAEVHPAPAKASYAFARGSRTWVRNSRPAPQCASPRLAPGAARAPLIAPRLVADRADSGFIRLHDSVSGRRIGLRRLVSGASARALVEAGTSFDDDTVSTQIGATAANDSLIYIGLDGGFAEGFGSLGGLYRVNRRTGQYEFITDSTLAEHSIVGLAAVGRWLWAGTMNPAEYGPYGDAGLLRMDQRTRAWKSYTPENSPLPDALVGSMKSDGRALAIATEKGLAVVELAAGSSDTPRDSTADEAISRWNVGWFVHAFVGDSLVFDVGDVAAGRRTDSLEAALTVAQGSAPLGHERPVFEALRGVPSDSIRYGGIYDLTRVASTDTAPASIHVAMLRGNAIASKQIAAMAIGALGSAAPEVSRTALRDAFARGAPGEMRAALGRALVRVGDSTATLWARGIMNREARPQEAVASPQRDLDIADASEILAESRDRIGLSLILSAAPGVPEGARVGIFSALAHYDTPQAWRAALAFVDQGLIRRTWIFGRLTPNALSDPIVASRVREALTAELRSADEFWHVEASQTIRRLRMIEMAPELIRLFSVRAVPDSIVRESYLALVSLTGRSDAPAWPGPEPVAREWWNAWLTANPRPAAVAADAGERAVEAWLKRVGAGLELKVDKRAMTEGTEQEEDDRPRRHHERTDHRPARYRDP